MAATKNWTPAQVSECRIGDLATVWWSLPDKVREGFNLTVEV